ncbi:DUF1499 domain-containing protein [Bacterioplanoides sp.]|uniref:DUF1499 domain-containing protein n=1 Tax=Bacterioplanoides sp. TaxID=2066072 RepID=UPI003AFF96E3
MPKLGVEAGQLEPCPDKPNCVSSQAKDNDHFIDPIRVSATQAEAKKRLLAVLEKTDNAEVVEVTESYVRAAFTSNLMRFVDDVEFYFPAEQSAEVLIHVRSASRLGHSDFGVNRDRVEMIREQLKN